MAFPSFGHSLTRVSSLSPNASSSSSKCLALLCPFSTRPPEPHSPSTKRTFSHIYQHCANHQGLNPGREAHAQMITSGFVPTTFVANCLMHMYIRCSNLDYARKVFDHMPDRDTISWNAMISGYSQSGAMGIAESLFFAMPERDVISWNSLLSGYLQNGSSYESIDLFLQMRRSGIDPDRATFAIILKSCAALKELELGTQIHGMVLKMGLDFDAVTGNAVVDMYAKCKSLGDSLQVFCEMPERNWVSWSVVIEQNGQYEDTLLHFSQMLRCGMHGT